MQCHRGRGAFPIEGRERRAGTPSRFQNDCAARLGRAAGMWRNRSDRRAAGRGFCLRFHPENHPPFHNRAGKPFEAVYVFFVPMLSSRKREPSIPSIPRESGKRGEHPAKIMLPAIVIREGEAVTPVFDERIPRASILCGEGFLILIRRGKIQAILFRNRAQLIFERFLEMLARFFPCRDGARAG